MVIIQSNNLIKLKSISCSKIRNYGILNGPIKLNSESNMLFDKNNVVIPNNYINYENNHMINKKMLTYTLPWLDYCENSDDNVFG